MSEAFALFHTVLRVGHASGHDLSPHETTHFGGLIARKNAGTFGGCILFITASFRRDVGGLRAHPHDPRRRMGVVLACL